MSFKMNLDLPQVTSPACIHLRSKAMYVAGQIGQTESAADPGSGACWCNQTQHVVGPDQKYVNRRACISGRDCFKTTY
jgi:hypothetical protein